MAELADATDLGSVALRHAGSTPVIRTKKSLAEASDFFIQAAGLVYHQRRLRRLCISPRRRRV